MVGDGGTFFRGFRLLSDMGYVKVMDLTGLETISFTLNYNHNVERV